MAERVYMYQMRRYPPFTIEEADELGEVMVEEISQNSGLEA